MAFRITGEAKLDQVARVLAAHGQGKSVKRRLSKTFRDEAEPITRKQRANLAARMPHRGGLAAELAAEGKFTTRTSLSASRSTSVDIVDSWKGHDMKAVDAGLIRHPVFGRWAAGQAPQKVPSLLLTTPFLRHHRAILFGLVRSLDALAIEIARET